MRAKLLVLLLSTVNAALASVNVATAHYGVATLSALMCITMLAMFRDMEP